MVTWIDAVLQRHPGVRWKVRVNCIIVIIISLSVVAGHITGRSELYAFGLSLGMSAVTAVCNLLICVSLLLLVPENE